MSIRSRIKKDTRTVMQLLRTLGVSINLEKSVIEPTQTIIYLGLVVRSKKMNFAVPAKKIKDIKHGIRQLLARQRVTIRKIASILGKIQATSDAMFPARIKTAELMAFKNQALHKASWTSGSHPRSSQDRIEMVAQLPATVERESNTTAQSSTVDRDGCIREWMGSDIRRLRDPQLLEQAREDKAQQRERADGNQVSASCIPSTDEEQGSESVVRQHGVAVLYF